MSFEHLTHPMVTHENWDQFTTQEHAVWQILFNRQNILLKNRTPQEVLDGMAKLDLCESKIPKLSDLNKILRKTTRFSLVPVKGFIPEDLFFKFLSNRQFPVGCFIRKPHQLDYLEEPDIFHDVFGHIPLLTNPIFADFMESFGHKGLEAIDLDLVKFAGALYWFTVEFGLIMTPQGIRIYGAGITSSKGESIYALESNFPKRISFNPLRAMKTKYHIDSFQKTYFVIHSFQQLFETLKNLNWLEIKGFCQTFPDVDEGILINEEEKIHDSIFNLKKQMSTLSSRWTINSMGHLYAEFDFSNFTKPLAFTNKIAVFAEQLNHHPNITIQWGKCSVEIWTHDTNTLTEKDFHLAALIDGVQL